MEKNEARDKYHKENDISFSLNKNPPSLSSLIMWNISKALEKKPQIDLRCAMRTACERLERESNDVNGLISQYPEERHVACAVLAWQQLGHKDTDSLYEFIESHQNNTSRNHSDNSSKKENICSANKSDVPKRQMGFIDHKPSSMCRRSVDSASFDTHSLIGPVVKLPVETKVVMRMENTSPCVRHGPKKSQKNDIKNKIDAACCLDTACAERLKELESLTGELRTRAGRLARREAERAELLERAEAAWRDLELGYQRRLLLTEEKEEEIAKQIKKCIEDRNAYKHACTILAQQLAKRGEIVENDRARLTEIEKEVCDLACTRLRLSEEAAKGDAVVAEHQCKAMQLDRDLQFKEEQARRKLLTIESVLDSSRGLTLEAERAMRAELGTIKEQIAKISNQLLEEDAESNKIKVELDELLQQKADMVEDLEGCKQMCDDRMQNIVDELNKKRQILKELKDRVLECQCKVPLDVAVEVKRTPSLAALCRCTPEEHIVHSCSCTSVRSTLLSNLLADLFSGLQAELGDTGALMPCQLLKCLEDKHNWDRASVVKSNLRNFFSRLLVGELDTAIATSIEKYHATWVGVSCADQGRVIPEHGGFESNEWQERAMESRAQKLASQLAEDLFHERADQLVQKAKDIVSSGPPPCECKPNKSTAYPCLFKTPAIGNSSKKTDGIHSTIKRALQDVTLLRTQIEDLKKDTIKKNDLRIMEEKLTKIVQQASIPDSTPATPNIVGIQDHQLKQKSIHRSMNTENFTNNNASKCNHIKNKINNIGFLKNNIAKTTNFNGKVKDTKLPRRTSKNIGQSYAVNLCLYDGKNKEIQNMVYPADLNLKTKTSQGILRQITSIKHSKPISKMLSKDNQNNLKYKKKSSKVPLNKCTCFHKVPSNTSIDKLIQTLVKWNGNLLNCSLFNMTSFTQSNDTNIKEIHHNSELSNNKKSVNISEVPVSIQNLNNTTPIQIDDLPPVTTSEYIGAINLDKSNEKCCKCNTESEKNEFKLDSNNNLSNSNLLFSGLDTNECTCKKKGYDSIKYQNSKFKDNNFSIEHLTDTQEIEKGNYLKDNQRNIKVFKSITSVNNKDNQTSDNKLIQNDHDVLVKFLGVTLADISDHNICTDKNKTNQEKIKKYNPALNDHQLSVFYSKYNSQNPNEKLKYNTTINHDLIDRRSKTNQYIVQNKGSSEKSNVQNNDLKCFQELDELLHQTKSCVCCNTNEDAKNLEMNTFYLLENHLKNKLANFKKSSGKSSCILPDEEEKAFLTIINKVKQVISECTYNVKCHCSTENKDSGSWLRFNSLLEEYLKIKIKKVQCSCVSNNDSLESTLPDVLEQVNKLIEVDLERLKTLCECKSGLERNKDVNENGDVKIATIMKQSNSCQLQPNDLCIFLENKSIQGSCSLEIENKSCSASQCKDTKDIETSLNDLSLCSNCNEVIVTHCCNLRSELILNTRVLETIEPQSKKKSQDLLCTDKFDLDATDINKEFDKANLDQLRIPYVGYTLRCSCDNNLGSCICSKSHSQSYLNNIGNIWKTLEINKKLLPNISYIMHGLPKKVRSDNIVNYLEVTDTSYVPVSPDIQSIKNTCTLEEEEIILKKSDEKFNQCDINDNMTNTMNDMIDIETECLNNEDSLYWSDCCNSTCDNDIIHKKAFYDSVYSPIVELQKNSKSDTSFKNVTSCVLKSKNCDCVMVPICHVKMLVDNIESKLANSQCTCDSLNSQVCPLHSKASYFG